MTTSGVQAAGMRSAGTVSGVRAGSRAAGSGSFADMLSVGTSSQKGSSSAQTNTGRVSTQAAGSPQEAAKNVQDSTQPSSAAQNGNENSKFSENEAVREVKPESVSKEVTQEETGTQDSGTEDFGENTGLDTEFAKSLKLFREAARTLEAQKLGELKQAIMDSMQIDEEDLEKLLEQVGANMQSLLQPQILQQIVVAAECGGDPMKLLTDETAMNNLKDLLMKAQEIQTDLLQGQKALLPEEDVRQETDFAQILADALNPNDKVAGEQTKEEPSAAEQKTPVKEDGGFSFEAVRTKEETAQTKEETSDGRNSESHAKTSEKSMAEQFLNLVSDAAPAEETEFAQLTRSEQVRAVADQILEKVRVVLSDTQTSMEISLTPESLGRVTLNLVSRHGALTAHFTAQNQIAKEAIESQIVVLRENLENQGLKVEAIEVTVSNFDFTQNGGAAANGGSQENRQRGRRGIRFDEAVSAENMMQGMSEAEQIAADLMERNGNQVDYTA